MTQTTSKAALIAQFQQSQQRVSRDVKSFTPAQLNQVGGAGSWSALDYFKHLILSVKPVTKALERDPAVIMALAGKPDHPSRSFDELVGFYTRGLAGGIQASGNVLPDAYRFPDGVTDQVVYLIQTWNEAGDRLIAALDHWSEADLDDHQLPHPALGMLTVREMLYFTIHHNNMHAGDIENAGNYTP